MLKEFNESNYSRISLPLRQQVNLIPWCSPIENQGKLGSCTGNAVVGAYELMMNMSNGSYQNLSRLFVYYNARSIEETIMLDSGAYIKDAVNSVYQYGICTEDIWPYQINKLTVQPSDASYEDAKKRNIKNYFRLQTIDDVLDALNINKPVAFGIFVYDSFNNISNTDYILKPPLPQEESKGAHAMCLVGYNLKDKVLISRNSFGNSWGDNGHCLIPFDYLENEFTDMWVFDIDLLQ